VYPVLVCVCCARVSDKWGQWCGPLTRGPVGPVKRNGRGMAPFRLGPT
jgi:hypothetical protein